MKKIIASRKSNFIGTSIILVISLFVFIMISYFGYSTYQDLSADIKPELTHNESVDAIDEVGDRYSEVFTGLIVLLFIGLWTITIVSAFVSSEHPLIFGLTMVALVFVLIAQMALSNFYEEFWSDASYTGVTAAFSIPNFIMTHALEIDIGIFILAAIIAFNRSRNE